jgi:acyl-coenzyme A thioesterase PaaI-like protein
VSELFEFGKGILESQPFSVLLGTELEVFEPGTAVLTLVVRKELKQQHGFVHGGVLSYLADKATVLSSGKNQAVCQCNVIAIGDEGERIVAVAQGTIIKAVAKI